ncbi:hypothetical protein F5J12DRAFT_786457 [Pisolithus orientalis]|uniref:uncharacterized protein n=1 Tax=Pisolithus orientalis TaxID=936130 RepID=UPI0022256580|nr:uncharacterized protein F5J12DRAFT_786457 [Pisolithus orientalis]KAI5990853.1 hypothetical protein F5J12DRAFT_786457 [Pisolithus orientalis]
MCYKQNEYPLPPVSVISKNDLLPDIMRCQRQELPGNTFRAIKALTKFARVLPSVVEVGGTQGVKPIDAVDPPRLHSAHCSESLRKIAKPHRCSTPQPSNHLRNPPDFCFPRSYIGFLHVEALILSFVVNHKGEFRPNSWSIQIRPYPRSPMASGIKGSRAVTFSFKEDLIHLQDAIGTPTVSCLRNTELTARPPIDGSFPLLNNISLVTDLEIEGGCHRPISTFCGCAMAKSEPYRIECIALQMVYLLSTPFYGKAVTLGRGGNDPDQWLTATLGYPT